MTGEVPMKNIRHDSDVEEIDNRSTPPGGSQSDGKAQQPRLELPCSSQPPVAAPTSPIMNLGALQRFIRQAQMPAGAAPEITSNQLLALHQFQQHHQAWVEKFSSFF